MTCNEDHQECKCSQWKIFVEHLYRFVHRGCLKIVIKKGLIIQNHRVVLFCLIALTNHCWSDLMSKCNCELQYIDVNYATNLITLRIA